MDILEEIVRNKRMEVARRKQVVPLETLQERCEGMARPVRSMKAALLASDSGIIAEFKRKSPSKGWLHPEAQVSAVVPCYEEGGAAACSVLTDERYFGGTAADLLEARRLVSLPLLRKDFVVDAYQLYEARVLGADAVLLIAAVLAPEACHQLACLAHRLGLEVLLEIHREEELACLSPEVDMLGVNNRNLGTFHTTVDNSFALIGKLRDYLAAHPDRHSSPVLVSESGLKEPGMLRVLRGEGFRGFLIGESFMKHADPGAALRAFVQESRFIYKVCGMMHPENIRAVLQAGANAIGLIFYPPSPRCVPADDGEGLAALMTQLDVRKVGVFVNAAIEEVLRQVSRYSLTHIQLHGDESADYCRELRGQTSCRLIKALPVASPADLAKASAYVGMVDYFLFDTPCPERGGSGRCFDWSLLDAYRLPVPFLLSGGLSPNSLDALRAFHHPYWAGIDLNSGVETAPGLKSPDKVASLIIPYVS